MGKLVKNVHVGGAWYGPAYGNIDPPADVAAQITNPSAWDQPPARRLLAQPPGADVPADPSTAEGVVEAVESFQHTVLRTELASIIGKPALVDFAERHDLEVDNRLGAAKMRAALEELLAPGEPVTSVSVDAAPAEQAP